MFEEENRKSHTWKCIYAENECTERNMSPFLPFTGVFIGWVYAKPSQHTSVCFKYYHFCCFQKIGQLMLSMTMYLSDCWMKYDIVRSKSHNIVGWIVLGLKCVCSLQESRPNWNKPMHSYNSFQLSKNTWIALDGGFRKNNQTVTVQHFPTKERKAHN